MKHIFFAFGLMAAIACKDKKEPDLQVEEKVPNIKDTLSTRVLFAYRLGEAKARYFIKQRDSILWVPKEDNPKEAIQVKRFFYDTSYMLNLIDTVIEKDGSRRPVDTFVLMNKAYLIRDLFQPWDTVPKVKDTTKAAIDTTKKK